MSDKNSKAVQILQQRYKDGEIDKKSFKRMLKTIKNDNTSTNYKTISVFLVIIVILLLGYLMLKMTNVDSKLNNSYQNISTSVSHEKNKLPIPAILKDKNSDPNIADFSLESQEGRTSFFSKIETQTMGYNGNFLGPVLRVNRGEKVNIHFKNKLKESTTIHWHGLEVSGNVEGNSHQGIEPGKSKEYSFIVNQPAATLWFHPHFIGNTATQVYNGLAGLLFIDDNTSKSLNIPKDYGKNDIPLIIQDRSFSKNGEFIYNTNMMDGAVGNTILVNGAITPVLDVKKVKMRFRIVNGANASNFNLKLNNNESFVQIASDGGFLEKPINQNSVFVSPGERIEIIVDFSKYKKGTKINLMSENNYIMSFNVISNGNDKAEIPDSLTKINRISESGVTKIKKIELDGMGHMVSINGQKFDINTINDTIKLGTTEIWDITNPESMMMHNMGHPFHIHGTQFQIISRDGKSPPKSEQGWKDTVFIGSGETVKIIVNFKYKGTFMYHCHILEHEEAGMMGQIKVE